MGDWWQSSELWVVGGLEKCRTNTVYLPFRKLRTAELRTSGNASWFEKNEKVKVLQEKKYDDGGERADIKNWREEDLESTGITVWGTVRGK